jgi:hypothetical protein
MPTARQVSIPSDAVDSLDDGLPLSQGSTLVEPDDPPADNTQDDVSLMGQTITTSAAANTVTTVGYIVDALPSKCGLLHCLIPTHRQDADNLEYMPVQHHMRTHLNRYYHHGSANKEQG